MEIKTDHMAYLRSLGEVSAVEGNPYSWAYRRIREFEAELAVRDNMGNEVLRILREATGKRDFHSEMEAAEWAAKMIIDLQTQLFLSQQSAKEAMDREAAAVSREIGVRAELADSRLDSARLDWLQEWMKFGRNDLLTRYRVFDGKVYANLIHPDAEMGAKAIPGRDNIRAAIDAAIKEAK